MSEAPKGVVRDLYSAVNTGDFERMRNIMADDFVEHEELEGLEQNSEGVLQFFGALRAAFPDLRMNVEEMIAEGDLIAIRATLTGTQEGELFGVPAKGNRIEVSFADFFRVRDGRVAEHWGVSDMAAMMEQMTS